MNVERRKPGNEVVGERTNPARAGSTKGLVKLLARREVGRFRKRVIQGIPKSSPVPIGINPLPFRFNPLGGCGADALRCGVEAPRCVLAAVRGELPGQRC